MWTQWYKTIGRASQAIEFTETFEPINNDFRTRLIGECKFRKSAQLFLVSARIRTYSVTGRQNLVGRAPIEDVYAYIEQDLQEAIQALPLKSDYANQDLGRATKGAAESLLAKVFLYQEKWQEAAVWQIRSFSFLGSTI